MTNEDQEIHVLTHRAPRNAEYPYFKATNAILTDNRLTDKQKIILLWVLSKPDGWQAKDWVVERELCISRGTYYRAMQAFESCGYLHRHTFRGSDGLQKYMHEWYEIPRVIGPAQHRVSKKSTRKKLHEQDDLALRAAPGEANDPESVVDESSVVILADNLTDSAKLSPVATCTNEDQVSDASVSSEKAEVVASVKAQRTHTHTDSRSDILCRIGHCDQLSIREKLAHLGG